MFAHSPEAASGQTVACRPIRDCGIGLREPHLPHILENCPEVPWFELLTDNYLQANGPLWRQIDQLRADYPLTFHGVGMSLGSTDALDIDYLHSIRNLMQRFEPALVSDHLAFTHIGEKYLHDLLPLPYTEEALEHISARILQAQDALGITLVIENVSSYLQYHDSCINEADFLSELTQRTGCELLLDINNVYVNASNHNFDARDFLNRIPYQHVREIHLGGHDDRGDYLLDAHNNPVCDPVWELYAGVMQQWPHIPTLIEWDNDLPAFSVLQQQAQQATTIQQQATQRKIRA